MRIRILFTLASLIFITLSSFCLASTISNSVSQDSLYIGDRIHYDVVLMVPQGSQVAPPATENGFGKFPVKEWTNSSVQKKSADSLTFHYIITTYSTENCTIPALDFILTHESKPETLRTQPVPMRVALVSSPDTALIKDLEAQQNAGKPSLLWLWILLAVAGGAAGVFLALRFRKKSTEQQKPIPLKPPYDEAIEALDRLEAKQYVEKGMIREHVFELSEIIKRYIERRFEVNAAEYTTEEMLGWVKRSPLDPPMRRSVEWFFSTADPVKFAKWLPDNDTINRFGSDMRAFVQATKPAAVQAVSNVPAPSSPEKPEGGNAA